MKKLLLLAALLVPALSFSEQVSTSKFKGLNNNENPLIICPECAQDLLNVNVSIGGQSIQKRDGYGLYKALATTKPMRGGYHFFDSSGNDVQVWGSSTSLYGIVGGATPTQLISSATLSSTWDCTDSQGSAYCVDSSRDAYVKTNGATMTWYAAPLGTMNESTPDRVVVAGVSGTPNTIYVSQSNTFTNFTTGLNSADPFTEVIASHGSRLTHLRWGCGKLLWWKDQSMGTMDFDDQFNVQIKTVSDTIGTFDNTSAVDPGGSVWFRGQDGHTYKYDCSFITKESIDITPNIQASGIRTSNSWTQTSQSDFQAGSSSPSYALSTTISPGDVIVSSFSATENSNTQWNSGVVKSSLTIAASQLSAAYTKDPSFEGANDGTAWSIGLNFATSKGADSCTVTPEVGSQFMWQSFAGVTQQGINVNLNTTSAGTAIANYFFACPSSCSGWTRADFSDPTHAGIDWWPGICGRGAPGQTYNCVIAKSSSTFYGSGSVWYRCDTLGTANVVSYDNFIVSTSAFYTSPVYDTGLTSATIQLQASWSTFSSSPTFSVLTATANPGNFTTVLTSTGTNVVSNRYAKYTTTFSVTGSDNYSPYLTSAMILSRSSGTYLSAVRNAPSFTSWDTLSVNKQDNGGSHSLYVRGGGTLFSIFSSTPGWTAATAGSLITASTGTFIQFKDDFSIPAATTTPTLSDFTLNWFEGTATDQSYMIYFDNAIWESVAFGAGQSTNNYIFKRDLISDGWLLYNFGAGGLLIQNDTLYFGDTSAGNVFNFGGVTSDNGSAITTYWKSREFTGQDPFLQNQITQIDTLAKKDQGTTLTATYTTDASTSTAYSVSLTTSAGTVQNKKILPSGKNGYTFNIKYGDASTSSDWEILGYRITFTPQPYRPTP